MSAINWTNVSNPANFLAVPNLTTNGAFWTGITFMVWIVLLISFIPFNIEIALLASAFIALIASVMLVYAGLVAWWVCLFFFGMILFAFLYIAWSNSRSSYS